MNIKSRLARLENQKIPEVVRHCPHRSIAYSEELPENDRCDCGLPRFVIEVVRPVVPDRAIEGAKWA